MTKLTLAILAVALGGCGDKPKEEADDSNIYTSYRWVVVCEDAKQQKCFLRSGRLPLAMNKGELTVIGDIDARQKYERHE